MESRTKCPSSQELRQLLDDELADSLQTECVRHLDSCGCCRESLERLATGGEDLSAVVEHIDRDRPESGSAFWPALRQLQSDADETFVPDSGRRSGEVRLDFLAPPSEPGALGRLSHFEVRRVIGRGGMGVVLEALDTHLQRRVAIKMLDPELAQNETARQRFCREARSAASISHEHVVAVHHVEKSDESGLPFLVMQLIDGETLEDRLTRERRLPVTEVVRVGMQVAAGLAAAHSQGLIHRDVKPGNILLERSTGRVKLTDFGLVRATEDVKLTQTGFVTGTPLYMAPEQALGETVDERTDLFSLGAVLYEAATGRTPFAGATPLAVLKRVADETPQPVQELNPEVPDWLAAIINRLLAKRPQDRFASAAEVAETLATHLSELQPLSPLQIPAVPTNCPHSGELPAPPQRRRVTFLSLAFLSALAVLGAGFWALWGGDATTTPPEAVLEGNSGPVWSVALSDDAATLLMAIDDGTVRIWDVPGGRVRRTVTANRGPVWAVAFSADGRFFATGSDGGTVRIWDAGGGEIRTFDIGHPVRTLAFAPTGMMLAVGCRTGEVEVWDAEAGERRLATSGHDGFVVTVAWSPDGNTIASASGDKTARTWDAKTGQELVTLHGHNGGVHGVAFTRDSAQVVTGGWDRTVRLWDAGTGSLLSKMTGHTEDLWAVACSPVAPVAASVGEDSTVRLWDLRTQQPIETFSGHTGSLYAVSFTRDGRHVVSAGRDGTARIWAVPAGAGG